MTRQHKRTTNSSESRRGVSDVIGFTLMFSVIILGVGMVSVTGYTQLQQLSDSEEVESAERGLVSAAATLEDINRQAATNRTFKLALSTGDVWVNSTSLDITLDGNTDLNGMELNSIQHRLSRSPEDITVLYEGGAVFRSDGGSARYRPTLKCDSSTNTAIINIVNLSFGPIIEDAALGSGYNSGLDLSEYSIPDEAPVQNFDRVLTFNASRVNVVRNFTTTTSTSFRVDIDVSDTADPKNWRQYFEDQEGWTSTGPWTYSCGGVERQLVRVTTILIQLENAGTGITDSP
jgi:hypothetical protein